MWIILPLFEDKMNWKEELKENVRSIEQLRRYYPKLKVSQEEAQEIEQVVQTREINFPHNYLEDLIGSVKNEKQLEQVKNIVLPKRNTPIKESVIDTITFLDNGYLDNNPITGLTQMYLDRVLISLNYSCMNHCLWCFRDKENKSLSQGELDQIYRYVSKHLQIRDIILTGGEPFLTSDERLEEILRNLRDIPHVDIIRFHTRAPVVLPSRIDEPFLDMVNRHKRKGKPVYVVTQFVHPNELSESSTDAVYRLTENGIMVLNQAPVLKGVNDDQETFDELNQKLIKYQVKPYYAIATIIKKGVNNRFYVPFGRVEELLNEYASKHDGLGRPTLIVPVMGKKLTPTQLKKNMKDFGAYFRNTKRDI
jgi:lysine 2,3-aminomutase